MGIDEHDALAAAAAALAGVGAAARQARSPGSIADLSSGGGAGDEDPMQRRQSGGSLSTLEDRSEWRGSDDQQHGTANGSPWQRALLSSDHGPGQRGRRNARQQEQNKQVSMTGG